jgi:hypothetical protein
MHFDPELYGERVSSILALDGGGQRLMPLALGTCSNQEAARQLRKETARNLFPQAHAAEAAMAGLWLYFSCLDESHSVSQEIHTADGSFWHGIMHRQEPDAGNSAYWFRRVGKHPVFPALAEEASAILERHRDVKCRVDPGWDPFRFIDFCGEARSQGGAMERAALEIQRAEWQLLFDFCARPNR